MRSQDMMLPKEAGKLWFFVLIKRCFFYRWKCTISDEAKKNLQTSNKSILIGAPHTSFFEGFIYVLFLYSTDICFLRGRMKFLMKQEAFIFPFKSFLLNFFEPIDRKSGKKEFIRIEKKYHNKPITMCYTPEGTRKAVEYWKNGFIRNAIIWNCPIILGKMNYKKKTAEISGIIPARDFASQDKVEKKLNEYYSSACAYHKSGFNFNIKIKPIKGIATKKEVT